MKNTLTLLTLFLFAYSYSQAQSSQFTADEDGGYQLPEITVPSPTAFQMTRYGDVQVNESSGKISPSIPLYNYEAGRLQLPISLNYQGNGVKVDQAASWTGINWNLNAGGVITRVVKDKDDLFSSAQRVFFRHDDLVNLDFTDPSNVTHLEEIAGPNIDSEVDMFHFSFPGYSGSFYFDEEFNAHLTKYDSELDIQLDDYPPVENGVSQGLKREIVITTPNGIKYYFGGLEASEESRALYGVAGYQTQQYAQTAFHLSKIEHPLGDEINFVYTFPKSYNIKTAFFEEESINTYSNNICGPEAVFSGSINHEYLTNNIRGRFLSKIYSNRNDYEVVLYSTDVNPNNSSIVEHYTKTLRSIAVKHNAIANDVIKNINLSYIYPKGESSSQRFFLETVEFDNDTRYQMEYKQPEQLPNRFDFDQDHLGYYNGKGNQRFIPKSTNGNFALIYDALADKSPNFSFSSIGTLTKLWYPTGGYTKFEYESGFEEKNASQTIQANGVAWINDPTRELVVKNPRRVYLGSNPFAKAINTEESSAQTNTVLNQTIEINLRNVISSEILDDRFHKFIITVRNHTDNLGGEIIHEETITHGYGSHTGYSNTILPYASIPIGIYSYPSKSTGNIQLEYGGFYSVELEIVNTQQYLSPIINANISFSYKVDTNEKVESLGIRVKKITDYASNAAKSREYSYPSASGSSTPVIIPRYEYSSVLRTDCQPSGITVQQDTYFLHLSSSSINSIYTNLNNERVYKSVIISYKNESEDNGYVEKEFIIKNDGTPINVLQGITAQDLNDIEASDFKLPMRRENTSIVNGTLKKETVFAKYGSSKYRKIKEINNDYKIDHLSTLIENNVTATLYNKSYTVFPMDRLKPLYIGTYKTISNIIKLESTVVNTYHYQNGSIPKVITDRTWYEYDQYIGQPSAVYKNNSDDDLTYKTEYIYPGLNTSISTYISEPLKTKTSVFKDGINRGFTVVNNKYLSGLLSEVCTLKNEEPTNYLGEPRLIYHKYDGIGNPIEISKADGTHVVYLWGYSQTKPIAKIENATYSEVFPYLDIANFQALSDADVDRTMGYSGSEGMLRNKLDLLRTELQTHLPNAQMTSFTYDPLIGVTSTTDPRGYTTYYDYDDFNRLEHVKDAEGNILSENEYNYKN